MSFPHLWPFTWFVRRVIRRVSLVEQWLLILPEHMSSHPVFSWVRVSRSLVFCVVFCRSFFVLLSFFLSHFAVCLSAYGFWFPFWSLQSLRISKVYNFKSKLNIFENDLGCRWQHHIDNIDRMFKYNENSKMYRSVFCYRSVYKCIYFTSRLKLPNYSQILFSSMFFHI